MNKEYLRTPQAAEFLSISELALRLRVSRGSIRAHKVGNKLYFKTDDLRNFIENGGKSCHR
ncbi:MULTISPECIES: helix-turn-helix domain-containing protein [Olivibacter]|uniref:Helix-turn-helix domain-containing protein n=1 Tax=Olivibacter jilunii TaxID=985016 RepID=A0ABW6AYF3_9SPHI